MNTQPTVRIASVAYNPGPEFERFIESLADASSLPTRVVVTDNGSQPDDVDRICLAHGVTVIRDGINYGYGGGINRALNDADEDYVVVANPDLVFEAGSIDRLIEAMARTDVRNSDGDRIAAPIGCVGPCLLNSDGTVYPSARALPSLRTGIGHALLGHVWPSNPWTVAYTNTSVTSEASSGQGRFPLPHDAEQGSDDGRSLRAVGWLSGACLVMRRSLWEELGGFDDRFFMFFEDVDLGRRIGELGYLNVYVPAATVWHEQGATWKNRPEAMIRAHHRSARLYFSDTHPGVIQAPLRVLVGAGLRVRETVMVRFARSHS